MKYYLAVAAAAVAFAADSPKAEPTKPPVISAELRAKLWRAVAENASAQATAEKAKQRLDATLAEVKNACGEFSLISDKDGEPICGPKPEPKKPEEKANPQVP